MSSESIRRCVEKLLESVLGVGRREVLEARAALSTAGAPPRGSRVAVDGLEEHDAVLLIALAISKGLSAGSDFWVYRAGRTYGIMSENPELSQIVEDFWEKKSMAKRVEKLSPKILSELRRVWGEREEDELRAIAIASEIVRLRNWLGYKRCPRCGEESYALIRERLRDGAYVVMAKRLCCGLREKEVVPIA